MSRVYVALARWACRRLGLDVTVYYDLATGHVWSLIATDVSMCGDVFRPLSKSLSALMAQHQSGEPFH
jgi:hypothetical protein